MKKYKTPLFSDEVPEPDEKRIALTVKAGENYIKTHSPIKTPLRSLFFLQFKYLSLPSVAAEIICLIAVCALLFYTTSDNGGVLKMIFYTAPLLSVSTIPELLRDVFCRMSEIERSCKYRGSAIFALRLTAVGIINIAAVALLALFASVNFSKSFLLLLLSALMSFNFSNALCLISVFFLNVKSRFSALCLSVGSAVLSGVLFSSSDYITAAAEKGFLPVMFLSSAAMLAFLLLKFFRTIPKGDFIYGTEN